MKKIFENWERFIKEDRIKIWSTKTKIVVKKPVGAAAVIEDTLALIRGIPGITVVNSDTDLLASTTQKAFIDLEFKFIPRSTSLEHDCKSIRIDILAISDLILSVSSVRRMLSTIRKIQ